MYIGNSPVKSITNEKKFKEFGLTDDLHKNSLPFQLDLQEVSEDILEQKSNDYGDCLKLPNMP